MRTMRNTGRLGASISAALLLPACDSALNDKEVQQAARAFQAADGSAQVSDATIDSMKAISCEKDELKAYYCVVRTATGKTMLKLVKKDGAWAIVK